MQYHGLTSYVVTFADGTKYRVLGKDAEQAAEQAVRVWQDDHTWKRGSVPAVVETVAR